MTTQHFDLLRNVEILDFEKRPDRGIYDEETPSTMCHPNGTLIASFDRPFCAAATREILAIEFATIQAADKEDAA